LDIPDKLLRRATVLAAASGKSLDRLVTEALEEKIHFSTDAVKINHSSPWMRGFGGLADLRAENRRVDRIIQETFGCIFPDDRL